MSTADVYELQYLPLAPSPRIVRLGDPASRDASLVGGKAAQLGRLAAWFPVPQGFVLTATEPDSIPAQEIRRAVATAYDELVAGTGDVTAVAVRSSAVDEDGLTASFAGQHETYLNVTGAADVADAVLRCIESARAERALAYRRSRGLDAVAPRVAVLVQELVHADASAVAFSADPIDGDRGVVVVNSSFGLGESIVGGTVTPDEHAVRKADVEIVRRRIADKRAMTVAVPGGTREVPVPSLLAREPALADERVRALARLAIDLERHTGFAVDVEAAFRGDDLFLLQCRPITTLA